VAVIEAAGTGGVVTVGADGELLPHAVRVTARTATAPLKMRMIICLSKGMVLA
jgi:hypothetical protein